MHLDNLTRSQLRGNQLEIADTIGMEAYRKLVEKYGGSNLYIGKADDSLREERNAEIYSKFNGKNYLALAHAYGLSEKTVHDIIRVQRELEQSNQMTLFLDIEETP